MNRTKSITDFIQIFPVDRASLIVYILWKLELSVINERKYVKILDAHIFRWDSNLYTAKCIEILAIGSRRNVSRISSCVSI